MNPKELKDVPYAELEVMDIVWQKGEATARDVHTELYERRHLAYSTVATLLTRLRDRGYVDATFREPAWVFRPLVSREQVAKRKLDDLVDRMFGGDVTRLAVYIAENLDLTPEEIAQLERIVSSAKSKGEG